MEADARMRAAVTHLTPARASATIRQPQGEGRGASRINAMSRQRDQGREGRAQDATPALITHTSSESQRNARRCAAYLSADRCLAVRCVPCAHRSTLAPVSCRRAGGDLRLRCAGEGLVIRGTSRTLQTAAAAVLALRCVN
jgi:hypothetical protein